MQPTINPGQLVIISSLPYLFSNPKVKDIIAFKSDQKLILKRIIKIKEDTYLVEGDNKQDSKSYGWINKSNLIGKVILVYN